MVLAYNRQMDTITRNVADIDAHDREAIEYVIGRSLADDQLVIISVAPTTPPCADSPAAPSSEVPAWWNIYEGLSDEEIDRLDQLIRQRATLSPVSG